MEKPEFHLLICNSFRVGGDPQGMCNNKAAGELLQYVEGEIVERGINAMVSSTGCLNACDYGPVMIIYPQGWWYGEVTEERIDAILDGLEEKRPVPEFLLA